MDRPAEQDRASTALNRLVVGQAPQEPGPPHCKEHVRRLIQQFDALALKIRS
jgi:hypothetical protein